jgi:hypothetical protein
MSKKLIVNATFSIIPISFDDLLEIHADFKNLLAFAQKHRPHSVTLLLGGYKQIKTVKRLFDALVNYRFNAEKFGRAVTQGIEKLNLLFRYLADNERHNEPQDQILHRMLVSLLKTLRSLLPEDGGVQLALFDDEAYQQGNGKPVYAARFAAWLSRQTKRPRWLEPYRPDSLRCWEAPFRQLSLSLSA